MPSKAIQAAPAAPENHTSEARAALLDAALVLFLDRGFAATRVEDIASRAGFSKGTVYLYFRSKRDLFSAVIDAGVVERLAQAEAVAAGFSGSATELLDTMMRNNLLEFWDSPSSGIPRLVIAESKQFPDIADAYFETVTGRARELLARVIRFGIERGEYRDLDVDYTARCILNTLDYEVVAAHAGSDEFDAHRFIDALLTMIEAGLTKKRSS